MGGRLCALSFVGLVVWIDARAAVAGARCLVGRSCRLVWDGRLGYVVVVGCDVVGVG